MGRMYVASVLLAITRGSRPAKVAEVELEPIVPGAWAAWAKGQDAADAVPTAQPTTAPSPVAAKLAFSSHRA